MKATELRIRNLIKDDGGIYEVERISFDHLIPDQYLINGYDIDVYSGITITEDWLKQFGFIVKQNEPLHRNLKYCDFSHRTKKFRIYLSDFKKHNSIHLSAGDGWFPELVEFEYVHQLQNIYFSLTGEELKLTSETANTQSPSDLTGLSESTDTRP